MSAIQGARERARTEVTAAIKSEARRQLAEQGAAKLSLRAVARELGMVSSALYRYFPSRDELLTALIIDAYDAVGAAAEGALTTHPGSDPVARWTAVCQAVRRWALAHPHEYALLYGSPVPGYSAPRDTVAPASRVGMALLTVAREARAAGLLRVPDAATWPPSVLADARTLADGLEMELPAPALAGLVAAWAQLFGLLNFELFGQFTNVVEAREEFFAVSVGTLARAAGLCSPEGIAAEDPDAPGYDTVPEDPQARDADAATEIARRFGQAGA
ncbi:TetR/AcrR family transcriptional regulator [Streptomyces palmae]|uniref:TetR/AcrR family transcriptional regulator n=1 Tax=Streptomyces palmae TaxID=1701085 RepID=A0A4Z0HCV1_9ACTN|nr:TetR/AcrR family transcriptional regulator [Streptomyces palmae]TGB11835.1 TetR/AcrR family transcriptional regulator [Streptomyces palmae]